MLKSLFISLFVCLLTLTFAQTNTILIIADDLGSDYFGFYENDGDTVDVPNIRRLMQAGVKFTNMMSNPVCSATRSSILTGRYGFRTGVGGIVVVLVVKVVLRLLILQKCPSLKCYIFSIPALRRQVLANGI